MILNLKQYPVEVLFPTDHNYQIDTQKRLKPFSEEVVDQLTLLGHFLMKEGRAFPAIVAAGYWLRKSHLQSIKKQYPVEQLQARGLVFHIAPGNVDTLFFYSMIISALCGNPTILRVSNKISTETELFLNLLNRFSTSRSEVNTLLSLLTVIQYSRDDTTTEQLSKASDTRVIWGSDETISHICHFPLANNSANNICFPDRYSVAVIHLQDESEIQPAVDNLLRDIKPYYQQACSSPKVVYWLNTARSLQYKFWTMLGKQLSVQENLETTDLIARLLCCQRLPLLLTDDKSHNNQLLFKNYELLQIAEVESLTLNSIKSHGGLWLLLSLQINKLDELSLFNHCQTVTASGIDQRALNHWQSLTSEPLKRIVPAGQALAFSHVWDGIDLVKKLVK